MRRNILFRHMLVISMFVITVPAYCGMVYAPNHIFKQWNNTTFSGEPCAVGQWSDIAWNMGSGGPTDGGCGQLTNNFSEEWTGYIKAPYTGTVTFYSYTDDRGYLYITDPATGIETNVVNSQWDSESSGTYNMVQGTYYPFRYRFIEFSGGALYYLRWSYPGQAKIQIPQGVFFHASSDCVQPDSFKGGFYDRNLWQGSDIGSAYMNAGGQAVSSSLTVTAGGADIWGTRDYFHYVWQYMSASNFDVSYRINSVAATEPSNAKHGIMARAAGPGSFYNSRHYFAIARSAGDYHYTYRTTDGGSSSASTAVGSHTNGIPGYLRLVKTGNYFCSYYSSNGTSWYPMGVTQTVDVGSHYLLGIAATSCNTSTNGNFTGQDFVVGGASCGTPTFTLTPTVTPTCQSTPAANATWTYQNAFSTNAAGIQFLSLGFDGLLWIDDFDTGYAKAYSTSGTLTYNYNVGNTVRGAIGEANGNFLWTNYSANTIYRRNSSNSDIWLENTSTSYGVGAPHYLQALRGNRIAFFDWFNNNAALIGSNGDIAFRVSYKPFGWYIDLENKVWVLNTSVLNCYDLKGNLLSSINLPANAAAWGLFYDEANGVFY